ncbi:MAG: putative Ig domain-containing protein [Aeromicrobium sp.]
MRATDQRRWLRRPGAVLLAFAMGLAVLGAVTPSAVAASSAPDHLVISAVYGSDGGAYNSDWVQLYNPTDADISLGTISGSTVTPNYYQCYRSVTSTSCSSMKLYGTVLAHHTFLIWNGHNADAAAGSSRGLPPADITPDLNFALDAGNTAGTSTDPSGQSNNGFGGYSSGGQVLLLKASSGGTYTGTGDLSSAAARSAGVVDAVGWTKYASSAYTQPGSAETGGAAPVTGASAGTSNAYVSSRTFTSGLPVDTDENDHDFTAVTGFTLTSQVSSRVTVAKISDVIASPNQPMTPIQAQGSKGVGTISYAATGLPDGVVIDPSTGVISGTPAGTNDLMAYPVTVTASDQTPSQPDTAKTSFTLTLSKALRVDSLADASVRKGEALTPIQVSAHGGTPGYTYAATGLPAGVAIDPGTGLISGTPTDAVAHYRVHVTVGDSGTGDAAQSVSADFTLIVRPKTTAPGGSDPLAGLRINEVRTTGRPADDWVELDNTGAAVTGAAVSLVDDDGDAYALPSQDIAAGAFVVVDGGDLHAAGLDLDATDTLDLIDRDGTALDETSWTSHAPTSWARTTDGAGDFGVSAFPTKGTKNSGAPTISPNDLLVSEVNYDNNSTDYYEYSEVTNTTDHPIDFAAYGLTLTKSGTAMTLHDASDTSKASPTVDPVIPAHGTQIFWWVENQYLGVKTTAQFRSNYGLPASTPVVLAFGFSSLGNSGGDHSYDLSVMAGGSTLVSRAYVDTPCAANTFNGASVCPATNNNSAEHYAVPADRSTPDAAVWYTSLFTGGDNVNHTLKAKLSSPTTIDLEQVGFTRAVKIAGATATAATLHNSSSATVDVSGYVLQRNGAGTGYRLPSGTTIGGGDDLAIASSDSGQSFAGRDYATLLAPRGYAYSDGVGIADTTGPLLRTLAYDASSGSDPVIDPTTGLPLPPAGGLYRPAGISAHDGTVYVSNTGDNLLATVAHGSNAIIAGSLAGYGELGNEGPATQAQLYQPGGTALDSHGNLYVADSGDNVIRVITTDGKIHRFAGTGVAGGAEAAVTSSSTPLSVNLWHPNDVVVDGSDNVFIADTSDNRILEVTSAGTIRVVAGTGRAGYTGDGSPAPAARLSQPAGVAVDADDNVYIADSSNNVVRRVDGTSGEITTAAGDYAAGLAGNDCLGGYSGDGGPATSALLNDPQGVAIDGAGDLFIADTFNHAIRQVLPSGVISTVVNVGAVAGSGNASPTGNGSLPATTRLNTPHALDIDPVTHNLYIADTKNNVVDEVVNAAQGGQAAGPLEPADQVAVTGSGVASSACAARANGPVVATDGPTVTGTLAPGATLTADSGTWSPTPDSFTYQWLRDGVAIGGATTKTYAVTSDDAGHALSVAVTAVKEDFASASATSAAVVVPVPQPGALTTAAPAVSGTVRVGLKVTARPGLWMAGPLPVTSYTYQWLRDGVPIPKATRLTYTLARKDHGSRISVRVTGSYAGYQTATVTSSMHFVAAGKLVSARPRITGRARVGTRLTVKPGTWRAGGVTLTGAHLHYQWYADGKRISGADHATLAVGQKYRGKKLTVKVTASTTGYATVARSSKHTDAVKAR